MNQSLSSIQLHLTEYNGVFKKQDKKGNWRDVYKIGNANMALDIARLLQNLGHKVKVLESK